MKRNSTELYDSVNETAHNPMHNVVIDVGRHEYLVKSEYTWHLAASTVVALFCSRTHVHTFCMESLLFYLLFHGIFHICIYCCIAQVF